MGFLSHFIIRKHLLGFISRFIDHVAKKKRREQNRLFPILKSQIYVIVSIQSLCQYSLFLSFIMNSNKTDYVLNIALHLGFVL